MSSQVRKAQKKKAKVSISEVCDAIIELDQIMGAIKNTLLEQEQRLQVLEKNGKISDGGIHLP